MATNPDFFDRIDTELKAYWLGFFYADGAIWKNLSQISLMLGVRDADHVHKFATLFGRTAKPYSIKDKRTNKIYVGYRAIISSKHLVTALLQLGIPRIKGTDESFPVLTHISETLLHHFIRGFFDGDGYVGQSGVDGGDRFSRSICLVGTEGVVTRLRDLLWRRLGLRQGKVHRRKGDYAIQYAGSFQLSRFRDWLYQDATICLERKRRILNACPLQRGTSRFIGVYLSRGNRWVARMWYDGKLHHIGSYASEVEAAEAHDRQALQVYGERAVLNFPPDASVPQLIAEFARTPVASLTGGL